eukprot:1445125-Pleurochrysis_carterae.AAC.1
MTVLPLVHTLSFATPFLTSGLYAARPFSAQRVLKCSLSILRRPKLATACPFGAASLPCLRTSLPLCPCLLLPRRLAERKLERAWPRASSSASTSGDVAVPP